MTDIEKGSLPTQVCARRQEVAAFLTSSIANGGHNSAAIRERFDRERYVEELVASAAHFPPEEIVHDPAELVPDAVAAIEEAAIVAQLIEYRRHQDEAA